MTNRRFRRVAVLVASVPLALGTMLAGATLAVAAPTTVVTTVDSASAGAGGTLKDSGIVLPVATSITFSATGAATYAQGLADPYDAVGVAGAPCGTAGGTTPCIDDAANLGALLVKIGTAAPVAIGIGPTTLTGTGPVLFAYNDSNFVDNAGSFEVTSVYEAAVIPDPEPQPEPGCISLGSACLPLGFIGS